MKIDFLDSLSVKSKFTVLLILVIVVVNIIVGSIAAYQMREQINSQISERLQNKSVISSGIIEIVRTNTYWMLASASTMPSLEQGLANPQYLHLAEQAVSSFFAKISDGDYRTRLYYNLYLFDSNLELLASADGTLFRLNLAHEEFAPNVQAAKNGMGYMSSGASHPYSGTMQLLFTYPIFFDNEFIGILAMLSNTVGFNNFLYDITYEEDSFVSIIDGEGMIFFSNRPHYIGLHIDDHGIYDTFGYLPIDTMFWFECGIADIAKVAYINRKPSFNWTIISFFDASATDNVYLAIVATVAPIAIGLVVAAVLMILIARWALKPLDELAIVAKKVAKGNLDVYAVTTKKDEISQVFHSFMDIVSSINILKDNFFEAEGAIKHGNLKHKLKDTRLDGAYEDVLNMTNNVTKQFHNFLDHLHDPIIVVDLKLDVLYANKSAVGIASNEDYRGMYLDGFVNGVLSGFVSDAVRNGHPHFETGVNLHKKDVELRCIPFMDDNVNVGSVIIILDVTHIKEIERSIEQAKLEAEMANTAKSDFLSKMSHEIRTPMNAIMGMSELILGEPISHEVEDKALIIKQSSAHLLSIINDILDFSKIESGKMEIIPAKYILHSVINDVISIIKVRMSGSKVDFVVYVDSKIPENLFGDEVRIRQILLNILTNAIKFTKKGYVAFHITGVHQTEESIVLNISIRDTGDGIKEEDIPHLFDEFKQFDVDKNRNVEGTGLGLPITMGFVKMMGGDITVHSTYGKGTEFVIEIPQQISAKSEEFQFDATGKKILYMSDYDLHTSYSVMALKDLGLFHKVVKFDEVLHDSLIDGTWTHVFVDTSKAAYVKDIIVKHNLATVLIMLDDGCEKIPGVQVISYPTYYLSVANILTSNSFGLRSGSTVGLTKVMFKKNVDVLVVDDIDTNLKVAEGLLKSHGIVPDLAQSGLESIDLVESKDYDIVFMDHMMPGMDGVEACKRIRETPGKENLIIVALTANAVVSARDMFLDSGFDDFLSKPIETSKLNSILRKWIPEEKQEASVAVSTESNNIIDLSIDGVDVKIGVSRIGGDFEAYLSLLTSFRMDINAKISDLQAALCTSDLKLYTTYVHAIKSASANVGALEVSEFAAKLEKAGIDGNMSFIQKNNEEFFTKLCELCANIEKNVQLPSADENMGASEAKDKLAKLKTAIDELDLVLIDEISAELEPFRNSEDFGTELALILDGVFVGDYDLALSEIEKLWINHQKPECRLNRRCESQQYPPPYRIRS